MEKSGYGKLLGVKKDSKLIFDAHVKDIRSRYTKKKKSIIQRNTRCKNWKDKLLGNFFSAHSLTV